MEKAQAENIPTLEGKKAEASTGEPIQKLHELLMQRRAMLEEAHQQEAISDEEYAERKTKLDEDQFKTQQEKNAYFANSAKERNALLDEELQTKRESIALDIQAARDDFRLTDAQKIEAEKALLKVERALVDTAQDRYKTEARQAALGNDASRYKEANQKAGDFQKQGASIDQQRVKLDKSPGLDSYGDQFSDQTVKLLNEFSHLAKSTAQIFGSVFTSATASISSGITQVIMGTKKWGQALREIEMSILNEVIGAIVQMGVRWVLTQIMMAVAGKSLAAASTASVSPFAAATAAMWATPATLATIATYGGAATAAPGLMAMAESMAIMQAAMGGGFAEGGYTGNGGTGEIAGLVHGQEFVMPADATRRIGLGNLEAMKSGSDAAISSGLSRSGSSPVHVHLWGDSAQAMKNHIRNNPGVQHEIIQVTGQNQHKFIQRRS